MDVEKKQEDRERDREAAGGRNDDRLLAEKQERVGRRSGRQTHGWGIDGQLAVETTRDSYWMLRKTEVDRLRDGETDAQLTDETVTDS